MSVLEQADHLAYAPVTIETELAMLRRLNFLAGLHPSVAAIGPDAERCGYCAMRPRAGNLCEHCEQRRRRLAAKHPDVPQLKPFELIAQQEPVEYPRQPTFDVAPRKEWQPWKEQED